MGLRSRLFASTFDRLTAGSERAGLGATRARLLADASGDVLEVGAGTGRNLAHYEPAVAALMLTEPDPSMLRRLQQTVGQARRPATVLRAPAEDLPFDDTTFDVVVSTLVLCGVADQPRAVREIYRVLEPGGRLLFIEHVRASDAHLARRQDRLNWLNRAVAGCDCNRPTLQTIEHGGFTIDDVTTEDFPRAPSFVRPLIVGTASRPVDASIPTTTAERTPS